MIIERSKQMMKKSFEETVYHFAEAPPADLDGDFGVYVHVPFCLTMCSFCPFYKELYDEDLKAQYLDAMIAEIRGTRMAGRAKWIYFGGGTPNLLTLDELARVVGAICERVDVASIGIELLPARSTAEYLAGLRQIGFTKVSIGVESLSQEVMAPTGRKLSRREHIADLIAAAKALGLWINVDLMVGLPHQAPAAFRADVEQAAVMQPSQVTLYPFMIIRGLESVPSVPESEQFALIEEANRRLQPLGYERKGIWTFAQGEDVYDSSRDELVEDYVGFGPAAFSTYDDWKVVNPELSVYLKNWAEDERMGFIAQKTPGADVWRQFARRIYDLRGEDFRDLPLSIRAFVGLLRLRNYIEDGQLTPKGIMFAHAISKAVVESLPFPVQNAACVANYDRYAAYKAEAI